MTVEICAPITHGGVHGRGQRVSASSSRARITWDRRHLLARGLCVAVAAAIGCVHAPGSPRLARRLNYWEALAQLHPAEAIAVAHNKSEKEFAESLRDLMVGDLEKAEVGFGELRRTATDSTIRAGSRVIYTATLQYQEKWDALAALHKEVSETPDWPDRASIESWAAVFKNVPPKTLAFRAQSMSLRMRVSEVGTPLVPVKIGDKVYNFWLDTGSSMTMLASNVARELNIVPLSSDTLEIVTSTGRVSAQASLISELQIGQIIVQNAPAMIVDESMMQMREGMSIEQPAKVKIDGIIGFDIIRRLDLEVDYGQNRIRLRNPETSRHESERNMFWVGLPVVRLTSGDGIALHFGLDTGAQETFVTETLLDKLELQAARVERRRVGGLGGEISIRTPILPDFNVYVRGVQLMFRGAVMRTPVYQVLAALDGVLGGDVWNSGVVRIDMTNGIFAVTRPRTE
jgi:predicted aspartyl protease